MGRVRMKMCDLRYKHEQFGRIVAWDKVQGIKGLTCPRIKLDNGRVVYGYQCFWTRDLRRKNETVCHHLRRH
jgi:hypothetical protein